MKRLLCSNAVESASFWKNLQNVNIYNVLIQTGPVQAQGDVSSRYSPARSKTFAIHRSQFSLLYQTIFSTFKLTYLCCVWNQTNWSRTRTGRSYMSLNKRNRIYSNHGTADLEFKTGFMASETPDLVPQSTLL